MKPQAKQTEIATDARFKYDSSTNIPDPAPQGFMEPS